MTIWILLEARHLNILKTPSEDPCKYKFYSILDDKIVYSQYFNFVESLI